VINSPTTTVAQVGVSFTYSITATNNPTSFNATNLPAGLSVVTSTGQILGTLSSAGTFSIGLSASNAGGTGQGTLTLTAGQTLQQAPVITSATTATATVGSLFSYRITATNNPTSFQATGLPPNLSINTTTGIISGTVGSAGVSNVGLNAANSVGIGVATLVLTIVPAVPGPPNATFTATPGTGHAPLTVFFDASASTGEALTYSWNFGDHVIDWGATTTHVYTQPGNYAATLTISNSFGTAHIQMVIAVSN
jgi:hypothetical protein